MYDFMDRHNAWPLHSWLVRNGIMVSLQNWTACSGIQFSLGLVLLLWAFTNAPSYI